MLSNSRIAGDGGGNANRLLTEDHARRLDGIAADIEQRAAAVRADVAYVVGVELEIAERAHCGTQLPDPAGAHQFHNPQPLRMVLHHEALADLNAGAVAHRHELERFLQVQADRFFAEHMLACLGGARGPRQVHVIGQRIVDGVDFRIGQHLLVRAVGLGNAEAARRRLCSRLVARRDAHDLAALAGLHCRNDPRHGNLRNAQHTPSNFLHDTAL